MGKVHGPTDLPRLEIRRVSLPLKIYERFQGCQSLVAYAELIRDPLVIAEICEFGDKSTDRIPEDRNVFRRAGKEPVDAIGQMAYQTANFALLVCWQVAQFIEC